MQIEYDLKDAGHGVGLGIFSKVSISEGTCIWKFIEGENVHKYDAKAAEYHLSQFQTRGEAKRWLDLTYGFNGFLCEIIDDGCKMNHSITPNCKTDSNGDVYSIKNIAAGEQLFEDYSSFGI
jgi:hypothetical protein